MHRPAAAALPAWIPHLRASSSGLYAEFASSEVLCCCVVHAVRGRFNVVFSQACPLHLIRSGLQDFDLINLQISEDSERCRSSLRPHASPWCEAALG